MVRIFNTNTNKFLKAFVPTYKNKTKYVGDYAIDGVPGTVSKILLDYAGTAGSATGKILPAGNPVDVVSIPSLGNTEMSIVDVANPVCFINANVLNLSGTEGPRDEKILQRLDKIELIRGTAAKMTGLVDDEKNARTESSAIPLVAIVSKSSNYASYTDGQSVLPRSISYPGCFTCRKCTKHTRPWQPSVPELLQKFKGPLSIKQLCKNPFKPIQ